MNKIDLSVVIAVKNESKHIDECIESIISQNLDNFEIIIINDHSDDGTYEKLIQLKSKSEKLRVYHNDGFGKVSAFNLGVSLSQGRWICLFAGDDIMPSKSLKMRIEEVDNLDCRNCFCVGISKIKTISNNNRFNSITIPRRKGRGHFSGQCYLLNKNLADILFPIPTSLPNEDTWISTFLQYAKNIKQVHNDIICCYYRIHDGNAIRRNISFKSYNLLIHKRYKAFEMILLNLEKYFDQNAKNEIRDLIHLENLRFNKKMFSILFYKAKIFTKLRFFINSNKFTNYLKIKYFYLFVGL